MCLFPNIGILKMFHVSKFIKYTRTQCPITYLKSYCNKMTEVIHDKKTIYTLFSRYIMDRFELERGSIQVVHET